MELVLAVLATTLFGFVFAPSIFVLTADWKWSEFDDHGKSNLWRTLRSTGAIFAAVALVVSTIAAIATGRALWTCVIGASVVSALCLWSLASAGPVKQTQKLAKQLDDPARREAARDALVAMSEQWTGADRFADSLRIGVAVTLSNAGYAAEAHKVVRAMNEAHFDGHERELFLLTRLECEVHAAQLEAAEATLSSVPSLPEGSAHDRARAVIEAALRVRQGRLDAARALLDSWEGEGPIERSRRVGLAHLYAASGESARLEATLDWLQREHPALGLERVVRPEGPASAAAWARMKGEAGPYRR